MTRSNKLACDIIIGDRCANCYGDVRGECLRCGFCIFDPPAPDFSKFASNFAIAASLMVIVWAVVDVVRFL